MLGIPIIGSWQIGWLDILDIFIVTLIFYKIFRLIQGTRAQQMFLGLLVLILLSSLADSLQLNALGWIVNTFRTALVVLFIILFESELRRAFTLLGRNKLFRLFMKNESQVERQEIVEAVRIMSEKRIGALVVIQQEVGLKNYIETGNSLQAKLDAELLISIFTVPSPLHDGAAIIHKDEIIAARCILPLTQQNNLDPALGTRHRAALGMAEETDALIIVVSEESGAISIARDHHLEYNVKVEFLKKILEVV
jgi:diadenylate cyclase